MRKARFTVIYWRSEPNICWLQVGLVGVEFDKNNYDKHKSMDLLTEAGMAPGP